MVLTQSDLTHKDRSVSWCVIMVYNSLLVFPQFCAYLTNCLSQSAHNFQVVFLIDRTTLWQEFMMQHGIANEEKSKTTFTIDRTWRIFSVLALLDASIGVNGLWFQCHGHTPTICRQLSSLWVTPYRSWTSSTFPENNLRCRKFHA